MVTFDYNRKPFKKWDSQEGRRLISLILEKRVSIFRIAEDAKLPDWETGLINRALKRFFKVKKINRTKAKIRKAVKGIIEELDIFRFGGDPGIDFLDRLDNAEFKGNRSHLARLLTCISGRGDDEWKKWRKKANIIPDLRGADLHELDLRYFDLSFARLQEANLSGALVRIGNLYMADLTKSRLNYTDFSYADLRGAKLLKAEIYHALFTGTSLENTDFRNAFLIGSSLNKAHLKGANLSNIITWGVNMWDADTDGTTKQKNIYVVPGFEPLEASDSWEIKSLRQNAICVNDLEVAHFISMLIANPKIGSVINNASDKIVLLLGRFTGHEKKILEMLKRELPDFGYVPVIFDFDEPVDRDTIETVAILAGLSNFVIANLSKPRSTPLEAQLIIPTMAVPFVPIIKESENQFSMFDALQRKYPWVLPTVTYRDENNLLHKLKRHVIQPAKKAAIKFKSLKHPAQTR